MPHHSASGPLPLPVVLTAPLGSIGYRDKALFEDKLALQPEYKSDGLKGGANWKKRVENHFISKAPVLKEILEWVEREDMKEITPARLAEAVGQALTPEQIYMVNEGV